MPTRLFSKLTSWTICQLVVCEHKSPATSPGSYLMWPSCRVKRSSIERVNTWHIRQRRITEYTYPCDQELRCVGPPALVRCRPSIGLKFRRTDFGIELDVFSQTKLVTDVVDVSFRLGLRSEVF